MTSETVILALIIAAAFCVMLVLIGLTIPMTDQPQEQPTKPLWGDPLPYNVPSGE